MEYRLRFTEITTLRPYMFIVIGFLVGCVMAWLIINYVSDNLLYLVRIFFVLRYHLRVNYIYKDVF